MWFPTMWHFDKSRLKRAWLVWAFAGRTYHIIRNLVSRLILFEKYDYDPDLST